MRYEVQTQFRWLDPEGIDYDEDKPHEVRHDMRVGGDFFKAVEIYQMVLKHNLTIPGIEYIRLVYQPEDNDTAIPKHMMVLSRKTPEGKGDW